MPDPEPRLQHEQHEYAEHLADNARSRYSRLYVVGLASAFTADQEFPNKIRQLWVGYINLGEGGFL